MVYTHYRIWSYAQHKLYGGYFKCSNYTHLRAGGEKGLGVLVPGDVRLRAALGRTRQPQFLPFHLTLQEVVVEWVRIFLPFRL